MRKNSNALFQVIYRALTFGLLAFCAAFGIPTISQYNAALVLSWVGCVPGAQCSRDSVIVARFEPFIGLLNDLYAPLVLFEQFRDILAVWLILIFVFAVLASDFKNATLDFTKLVPIITDRLNHCASMIARMLCWVLALLKRIFAPGASEGWQTRKDPAQERMQQDFEYVSEGWQTRKDPAVAHNIQAVLWTIFWILFVSFVVFCIVFGTPLISMIAATVVVEWAGCEPASFAIPSYCTNDSIIGARFGNLTGFATFLAPLVLLIVFWDVLLIWLVLVVFFAILAAKMEDMVPTDTQVVDSRLIKEKIYVGLGARVGAGFIDALLIVLMTLPFLFLSLFLIDATSSFGSLVMVNFFICKAMPAVAVIGFWRYKQATPGKMVISAKIVDATTGRPASTIRLVVRYFAYSISVISLGVGFFWIAFDKRKQGWHDKLAGTVVIRAVYAGQPDLISTPRHTRTPENNRIGVR